MYQLGDEQSLKSRFSAQRSLRRVPLLPGGPNSDGLTQEEVLKQQLYQKLLEMPVHQIEKLLDFLTQQQEEAGGDDVYAALASGIASGMSALKVEVENQNFALQRQLRPSCEV